MIGRWFSSGPRNGRSKLRQARWLAAALLAVIVLAATFASAANISVPASHAGVTTVKIPHAAQSVAPNNHGAPAGGVPGSPATTAP
jgi:hypothetical protein